MSSERYTKELRCADQNGAPEKIIIHYPDGKEETMDKGIVIDFGDMEKKDAALRVHVMRMYYEELCLVEAALRMEIENRKQ